MVSAAVGFLKDILVKVGDKNVDVSQLKHQSLSPRLLAIVVHYLDSTKIKPHGVWKRKTLLDKGGQIKHRSPEIGAR